MRFSLRAIISIGALLGLMIVLTPSVAHAADWIPIVQCGGSGQSPCTPCDIFASFKRLIDFVLYGVTGPVAAFMIVFSGGMMLLGGGKPDLYGQGKKMLTNTLYGVGIILIAWIATNFLIRALMPGVSEGSTWFEFSCPASLSAMAPIETSLPTNLPPLPSVAPTTVQPPLNLGANFSGVLRTDSGGTVTGPGSWACPSINPCVPSQGLCANFHERLTRTSNPRLLESIMARESSCRVNPPPSGAGAYGLMQMKPETANGFRSQCGVREQITSSWLQSEQNIDQIICIADAFVSSLGRACGTSALNLAAGYNGGPGACAPSRDCKGWVSCSGEGNQMRAWECPYADSNHVTRDSGYAETRVYAPRVASCAL